jgi:hypothetical protein
MKESELISEIGDMIQWYKTEGDKATIGDLLSCRDQIATNCWSLAQFTGDAKTDYNQVYFQRKIEIARQKQAMFDRHEPNTKADVKAIIASEGLFNAEILKEGYAFKLDLMLKAANKVVDAISQRVSYLKIEETQTRFQNQT